MRAFGWLIAITMVGGCNVKHEAPAPDTRSSIEPKRALTLESTSLELGSLLSKQPVERSVEPLLAFDTSFVDLRPEFGTSVYQEVAVVGAKFGDAKPSLDRNEPSSVITVNELPKKTNEAFRFRITCKGDRVGMHAGSISLKTGLAEPPVLSLSWGCRVPGTLEVNPSTPYFNLKVSGERAVIVEVKSAQPDFTVRRVRIKDGPFSATFEPSEQRGAYHVVIKTLDEKIPDETRGLSGTLLIESNDRREPLKEVPLFGFGQINKVRRPD
jgi:hypothetical protein